MLELQGVTKTYRASGREVRALDDVTFGVDAGEFVVVEGPSGSGKTTLLFTMGGMTRPSAGKVLLEGVDLAACPSSQLAELRKLKFGFVFQMFHLVPYLSALENVMVPMGLAGVTPAEARKRASALLERFGLADRAEHFPAELSAGEKQRVAIARAVANEPPVVLADEPTGNLDKHAAERVFEAFEEIHQGGTSVIVVTHDARMSREPHRFVRLEKGKLVD